MVGEPNQRSVKMRFHEPTRQPRHRAVTDRSRFVEIERDVATSIESQSDGAEGVRVRCIEAPRAGGSGPFRSGCSQVGRNEERPHVVGKSFANEHELARSA